MCLKATASTRPSRRFAWFGGKEWQGMCLKWHRAARCEGLAVLSCPMPGTSLRVLLSRCHRPLYVRFLPLDREHQSALF